ncbi:oxygenase MpaB family protein [Ketobacter sp.]|uniref:oxygenase MpaB family protein n=1 Tax=Ketobacter sp. TaxID=2083498 RepID=UPI000F256793|nr:oxygenase MpaB family protein [Ketobacter sp.]RLU00644.1 MAG: DUF2236 domain-containing protein [Ketobacter sp.]
MSTAPAIKTKPIPQALGPDSLAWQHAGDNLQLLIAGTTLLLQVSHPVVGAGVGDHSVFKKDPWGRLKRTTEWGLRLLYGGPEGSPQAGRDLRELHRGIKGSDDKGRRYFALDPEAYTWVHMTTYYTLVNTQKYFGDTPFTPEQEAQLYDEWVQQGRVLGIRDEDMPQDVNSFWEYFEHMVSNRLEVTDTGRYLLDVSLSAMKKPPALKLVPNRVWRSFYRSAGNYALLNTVATLPPTLRIRYGLSWDARQQKRFRRWARVLRLALPLVPAKVRYMPPVYHTLKGDYQTPEQRAASA